MGRKNIESFKYLRQCRDCGGLFKTKARRAKFCMKCMMERAQAFLPTHYIIEQEIVEIEIPIEEMEEVDEEEIELG